MNEQLKPFKTVEQIANKHKVDVAFIRKQLDVGEKIEHEHTKNHKLAREIALQHLDEIPDYYTRLKKLEKGAKKDIKEECQCKDNAVKELEDSLKKLKNKSYNSIDSLMRKIMKKYDVTAKELHNSFVEKNNKTPDEWINEDLRNWFSKSHPEGNWKRYNTKGEAIGPCAREPGEPKPKCLSNEKAAKMSKSEIAASVKRKREKDPVADRKGKGGKPIMSSNKIDEEKKKRYCTKCKKIETRDECAYGPEMWDKMTVKGFYEATKKPEPDHEHSMARSELSTIEKAISRLRKKIKGEGNIEAWVQSKITKAADYIDSAADYLDSGEHNVHGSMDEEKDPCWVGYKQVGMKKKGNKMVPNCVKEEENIEEENQPTNPALWSRAKALAKKKFDVYPSAYANGWASKWYKSKGGGWKSVKEETIEDLNGNTFAEVIDLILPDPIKIEEAMRIQSKFGNLMMVILMWRGKTYSLRVFFPQVNMPNKKEVEDQIQKVYPGARVLYSRITEHEPGQPFLYSGGNAAKLGPNNNYIKPMGEEVEFDEDWQKVNRQDKTDGLSQKAVNAYRRENPGSKLQTAVTEKNPTGKRADRRKSFCRRMKGMKSKLTSSKTARDPDSRINKALRRWNCN